MQPKHIVIIEDDPDILYIMEVILRDKGYRVTSFNEVESLEELLDQQADLFILDEQLPNVSGHIICVYLRSKPKTAKIPVVLISAHPQINNYADLCDANAYLSKPFDVTEMIAIIDGLLH